ncbi:hypothetical protein HMPREF0973_03049 [Prevotella veroralis F0319]|uniref:Uncharacterized protein n=1 Tax=Prevotella veroralis F0319 TaxID=649761 RepID=C9MTS1_9BACT|nr:hypothetical protein HMPREF0973_03049 [Prevotella veroralis F0319]
MHTKIVLQSRDRRPRLSSLTSLHLCEKRLPMRTDEGVCPYLVAISLIKGTPFSN